MSDDFIETGDYGKVSGIYTFPFTIENHIGKVL
jgi:hypothetical protein